MLETMKRLGKNIQSDGNQDGCYSRDDNDKKRERDDMDNISNDSSSDEGQVRREPLVDLRDSLGNTCVDEMSYADRKDARDVISFFGMIADGYGWIGKGDSDRTHKKVIFADGPFFVLVKMWTVHMKTSYHIVPEHT